MATNRTCDDSLAVAAPVVGAAAAVVTIVTITILVVLIVVIGQHARVARVSIDTITVKDADPVN